MEGENDCKILRSILDDGNDNRTALETVITSLSSNEKNTSPDTDHDIM